VTQTVDTPDYQRGVTSAQTLLAHVTGGARLVTVGVPPSAETLVVLAYPGGNGGFEVQCIGQQSGINYPAVNAVAPFGTACVTTYFDVSSVIDQTVLVTNQYATGAQQWWVYADSAPHVIATGVTATDSQGSQYVTCIAPSTAAQDHPPVELRVTTVPTATTAAVLGSLPVGERYRLFSLTVGPYNGVNYGNVSATGPSGVLAFISQVGPSRTDYGPSGFALASGEGVNIAAGPGSAYVYGTVTYTIENI
jgi:hypothetical protein